MSTPSTNPISLSRYKGFAFSTPKMMPLFKENIGFWGGFPLPFSVSALVGSYETRAVVGLTLLKYPGPNMGKYTSNIHPIKSQYLYKLITWQFTLNTNSVYKTFELFQCSSQRLINMQKNYKLLSWSIEHTEICKKSNWLINFKNLKSATLYSLHFINNW